MADCADLTYAVLKMDQLMAVIVLDNEGAGGIRVDRRKILTEVRVERTGAAGIEAGMTGGSSGPARGTPPVWFPSELPVPGCGLRACCWHTVQS